jgi:hypothetical protein
MQLASSDGYHHLPPHDLPFEVGIGIIFKAIMMVLAGGSMGSEFF